LNWNFAKSIFKAGFASQGVLNNCLVRWSKTLPLPEDEFGEVILDQHIIDTHAGKQLS
jgi:hypothetical protein